MKKSLALLFETKSENPRLLPTVALLVGKKPVDKTNTMPANPATAKKTRLGVRRSAKKMCPKIPIRNTLELANNEAIAIGM